MNEKEQKAFDAAIGVEKGQREKLAKKQQKERAEKLAEEEAERAETE